jgi:hypothetical protein
MPLFKKLATLATAAAAARSYAKKNPDQASRYVDQAAQFIDKQTKGKYSSKITGAASKAKNAAGIRPAHGAGPAANGYPTGRDTTSGYGTSGYGAPGSAQPGSAQPGSAQPGSAQPGQPHPGTPTP